MASLTSNNKSIDELFKLLSETSRAARAPSSSRCSRADRDAVLIAILKQQQETIEQNKKTIKEQKELIEALWAWAEEKEEESVCSDGEESQSVAQYLDVEHGYEAYEDGGEEEKPDTTAQRLQGDSSKYIDYSNFKLCDEYCGERQGYTYLHGIHGPGYYALKMPLQWTPRIY